MTLQLLTMMIHAEEDVVGVRQRAHQIARLLDFDEVEQTRIATSVSEIARNAFEYAKSGKAEFYIDDAASPPVFCVRISDNGPGIDKLDDILDGRYQSPTGMGIGMSGARRLMDLFKINSDAAGTAVVLGKTIARPHHTVSSKALAKISQELAMNAAGSPLDSMQRQNREILMALKELERRQTELLRLNRELAETNRGVVALYAELDSRAEEARRAGAVKTRFLSHMTHEFRTPVNSVLHLTGFLLDRTDGDLTPEQDKQLRLIQRSMEDLSEMVNDLLDLAKVDAGKIAMRVEDFTVDELFASLRGMFRPLAKNPKVELVFEIPAQTMAMRSDEGKISQILRNLISNAMKFTEAGAITVTADYDEHGDVIFSVADTGIGIAAADQPKIFEEFSQIENSIQKKVKGTGLGLPLAKKLAELLNGHVELKSALGQGSVFSLIVPPLFSGENEEADTAPSAESAAAPHTGGAALIIDDNEATCYMLRRALMGMSWNVTEARDGAQGLRKAREDRPQLIFLDVIMPDMTGFEVLENLKRAPETRDIPVVLHTSQLLSTTEKNSLGASVAGIIAKDMNLDDVTCAIKKLTLSSPLREAS